MLICGIKFQTMLIWKLKIECIGWAVPYFDFIKQYTTEGNMSSSF